ncbi:MAG: magnesium chelatase domain-containing protein [Syntrophobacteraceae bacterium]
MIAKTYTCSLLGIDAVTVEVEVDISSGLPYFATVGLPDNIVRESKDRVKAALQNTGYSFPAERITVNLAGGPDTRYPGAERKRRGSRVTRATSFRCPCLRQEKAVHLLSGTCSPRPRATSNGATTFSPLAWMIGG